MESQQLLQEAEVSMSKLAVEKEHLEFLQSQKNTSKNGERLDLYVAIDEQEEDAQNVQEGMILYMLWWVR